MLFSAFERTLLTKRRVWHRIVLDRALLRQDKGVFLSLAVVCILPQFLSSWV